MPRFSVIIPIYNKEKDVETTIKSVLNPENQKEDETIEEHDLVALLKDVRS